MARVVFLHRLPVSFAVRGRGFTGTGSGERRLSPYQLCSDRGGERPMKVGLFEMPAAAERYASSKGWTMEEIPFDNSQDIRLVGDGIKRAKSEIKIGSECHHIDCGCINTKHPYLRHIDSWARKLKSGTKLPAKYQAVRDALPQDASGWVCPNCFHMDREHRITLDAGRKL